MKITCPQCGADIALRPRSLQLICTFCNTPLLFEKEPFLESYRLELTCEEEPAISMAKQFLIEKNKTEEITKQEMLYLPFYRFLYEKNGKIVEKAFSALNSPPFLLFSIPSGSVVPLKKDNKEAFIKPEKNLSLILEKMKKEKARSLEEMLLLYLPFWKITISSGEIIWLDAVQGKIFASNVGREQIRTGKLLKILFSGFFILLLIEGIAVHSNVLRFLLQGITAIGFFYFVKKTTNSATKTQRHKEKI